MIICILLNFFIILILKFYILSKNVQMMSCFVFHISYGLSWLAKHIMQLFSRVIFARQITMSSLLQKNGGIISRLFCDLTLNFFVSLSAWFLLKFGFGRFFSSNSNFIGFNILNMIFILQNKTLNITGKIVFQGVFIFLNLRKYLEFIILHLYHFIWLNRFYSKILYMLFVSW